MSRSCHRATSSSPAWALPRSTRARPATCSDLIGLRLWGIALEPFWPAPNGSWTSRTSVRARWRISVANRSSPAPGERDRLQQLGVAVAGDDLGGDRLALEPEPGQHALLELGDGRRVGADGARERADRRLGERALAAAARCGRPRTRSPASLIPNVVGSAWMPWVRPTHSVCDVRPRLAASAATSRRESGSTSSPTRRSCSAEPGVEHVAGGEAVVDPASGRTGRGRQHVDERRRVVVGDALALGDRLDGERGRADRLQVRLRGPLELLGGGHLDLAHRFEVRVVRPDLGQLGPGVPGDHSDDPSEVEIAQASRMRAASTAVVACSMGTPYFCRESSDSPNRRRISLDAEPRRGKTCCLLSTEKLFASQGLVITATFGFQRQVVNSRTCLNRPRD